MGSKSKASSRELSLYRCRPERGQRLPAQESEKQDSSNPGYWVAGQLLRCGIRMATGCQFIGSQALRRYSSSIQGSSCVQRRVEEEERDSERSVRWWSMVKFGSGLE